PTLGTWCVLGRFAPNSAAQEDARSSRQATSRFSRPRDGATLGLSRPLDGVTAGLIRLRSEFTNFSALALDPSDPVPCGPAPDPRCPPPSLLTPGRVVSVQLSAIRDTRNSRFAPTSGDRILASAELAPLWLGGEFDFTKLNLDYQRLFPTGGGAAFVVRLLGGLANGTVQLQDQLVR